MTTNLLCTIIWKPSKNMKKKFKQTLPFSFFCCFEQKKTYFRFFFYFFFSCNFFFLRKPEPSRAFCEPARARCTSTEWLFFQPLNIFARKFCLFCDLYENYQKIWKKLQTNTSVLSFFAFFFSFVPICVCSCPVELYHILYECKRFRNKQKTGTKIVKEKLLTFPVFNVLWPDHKPSWNYDRKTLT